MDLRFSEADHAFRAEVRRFIETELDPRVRRKLAEHRALTKAEIVDWQRRLNTRGWATPSWPVEHGGPGWSAVQRYIFLDELHQAPAPEPLSFNVNMIGPVLIRFGTPEQQQRFLPRIANLDDWWAQGFSEPGAGSDLAALKTRAVLSDDGQHYVVSGQKIWQGMAQHADWMFTLVRTDPASKPQAGITMLLIPMRSPGVTVRPIVTLDGRHEVNEVFLDEVRVPVDLRVGDENRGWDITKYLLGHERTGIARIGMTKRLIARAKALAASVPAEHGTLADQARFREQAAAIEIELKALEITQLRLLDAMRENGQGPDVRASIVKVKGTELRQAASELLLQAAGPRAWRCADEFDDAADADTTIAATYFTLRAASIYGGSNEVQKNILAKHLLQG
ncbi:acyl-CoA dehydrogenase family protein [Aquincola sp. S2]|uniref:Acyl-CoA dehydrogenase family protein n=1 Tax=Pseudaquabacterium terrae TaxID=2732868 RepID=A0ABX2ETN5_9BURK|nr:acyl-CoA dehydrogenase family protein [Aquabacterium terrae]NRF72003.1 acyl-CoA dehydrogenase family protein [Aquabacterium terrae]